MFVSAIHLAKRFEPLRVWRFVPSIFLPIGDQVFEGAVIALGVADDELL